MAMPSDEALQAARAYWENEPLDPADWEGELATALDAFAAREREECAKLAMSFFDADEDTTWECDAVAAAIRGRK